MKQIKKLSDEPSEYHSCLGTKFCHISLHWTNFDSALSLFVAINIFLLQKMHDRHITHTPNDRKELSVRGMCNDLSCEVDILRSLSRLQR